MTDLISRDAVLQLLRAERAEAEAESETLHAAVDNGPGYAEGRYSALDEVIREISDLPATEPRVAIGVNGGAVQWAMADHDSVDVMIVDFDIEGTGGFEFNLIRDSDGDRDPAYVWRETPSVDPGYFEMLSNSPSCNESGELESAEPNSGAWHIITDVMQCGPDGVHETHDGYYGGSQEEALAEHERELHFLYGEYKTGPAGRIVRTDDA